MARSWYVLFAYFSVLMNVACSLGLFAMLMWGFIWVFLAMCGVQSYWLYQLYCLFGVFLFMAAIIVDTARLMSKFADPDEYILVAVTLYLDVLNLFLFLLRLLGNR